MSNMPVSANDQLVATQLAYAHFDEVVREIKLNRGMQGEENPVITVDEAVKYALNNNVTLCSDYERFFSLDENGEVKYAEGYEHIADWKIIDPVDERGSTGFAACILDTGDARILACRGSEAMNSLTNLKEDWMEADLMLLNSEMTKQEEALAEYMREHTDVLSEKPWVSAGHSLGGALADYAAVMSVELTDSEGNKTGIENYAGTINFDGPNHSFEFQEKYKDAIAEVSPQMEHRIASIVGELLPKLPGVKVDYVITNDAVLFEKHDTKNWIALEGGSQSREGFIFEKLSVGADRLPAAFTNWLPTVALTIVNGVIWAKDFSGDHPEFAVNVVSYLIANPTALDFAVGSAALLIVSVASLFIVSFAYEVIYEKLVEFAQTIAQKVCAVVDRVRDKAAELFESVTNLVNDLKTLFNEMFNQGAKYAASHPFFRADTDLLYSYAARLSRVNSRLRDLDSGLRSLFWQVGFLDLWNILYANLITCESLSLVTAKNYLSDTADRLSRADGRARGYMEG